jgi:ABC-2 type transport system ATP-binding protein
MNIIQTENLNKSFGSTKALADVSINVRAGEIYGFLGLNGAGKSTAIRLILNMIKPDSGSVHLFGEKVGHNFSLWNKIGYLVETPSSYPNLSVRENLEVYHRLRGLTNKNNIEEIISLLKLNQYENIKARHLSMGNNQRLGLAKALIHKPELLILDEPINGLDPSGIVEVREFLRNTVEQNNTTIFLSSHILSEISKLATRIGIVHEGRLIREINADDLVKHTRRKLCVKTGSNDLAVNLLTQSGFEINLNEEDIIEISDQRAINDPAKIATILVNSGLPPTMLNVFEEDLETFFLRIISQ